MRLTPNEIDAIVSCARTYFGALATVRLFGSRVNDDACGGDIDLHIQAESAELATLRNELAFSAALKERIGEQRIDVVLRPPVFERRPIDQIAHETGVELP